MVGWLVLDLCSFLGGSIEGEAALAAHDARLAPNRRLELGCATDAELRAAADNTTFSDIFEYRPIEADGSCAEAGFAPINAGVAGAECLRLVPGQETLAAFFETRRYGALLGATTEFSKWEGFAFSPTRMEAYTALSEIRNGMEDGAAKGEASEEFDLGGPNSIKVAYNPVRRGEAGRTIVLIDTIHIHIHRLSAALLRASPLTRPRAPPLARRAVRLRDAHGGRRGLRHHEHERPRLRLLQRRRGDGREERVRRQR